jgi:hypothetical protein
LNRPKGGDQKKISSGRKGTHGAQEDDGQFGMDSDEEGVPGSREKIKDSEEIDELPEHSIFRY